jgi:hypothetical protein
VTGSFQFLTTRFIQNQKVTKSHISPQTGHVLQVYTSIRLKTVDISHFQIAYFFWIKNLPRVIEKLPRLTDWAVHDNSPIKDMVNIIYFHICLVRFWRTTSLQIAYVAESHH